MNVLIRIRKNIKLNQVKFAKKFIFRQNMQRNDGKKRIGYLNYDKFRYLGINSKLDKEKISENRSFVRCTF